MDGIVKNPRPIGTDYDWAVGGTVAFATRSDFDPSEPAPTAFEPARIGLFSASPPEPEPARPNRRSWVESAWKLREGWPGRRAGTLLLGVVGGSCLLAFALLAVRAYAQDSPPPPVPPPMIPDSTSRLETPGQPSVQAPKAVARAEGIAARGQIALLVGDDSEGDDLQYRWTQTAGPPVILENPYGRSTRFTVPDGADSLGFLLVVSNREGTDATPLTVPIEKRASPNHAEVAEAHAGDDQIALVNRQVTLNGTLSEPKDRVAFRWVQVVGPPVRLKLADGPFFSFVPALPGTYRFALVVGIEGSISEPDEVTVTVASSSPTGAVDAVSGMAPNASASASGLPPIPPEVVPTSEVARSALASIVGGPDSAGPLADAFELAAGRVDIYRSYAEAFSEISRNLAAIVPNRPEVRTVWNERLFIPLTGKIVAELLEEGLDLRRPEAQDAQLSARQRARLADVLRSIAEGLRSASTTR